MANGREALATLHRVLLGAVAVLGFAATQAAAQVVYVELRVVTEATANETYELPDSTADICLSGDFALGGLLSLYSKTFCHNSLKNNVETFQFILVCSV